jgi:glycosyltransferase involved in cell wall biosynthesis
MATIWLVRAYTPPMSAPGAEVDRNYHFARALIARGHEVVMITSAIARLEGAPGTEVEGDYLDETADRLTVRVLKGRPYSSTSQRLLSMLHFERTALRSTRGLPQPDLVVGTIVDPFAAHAGQVLAGRHGVPFILELGDIWPRTLVDMGALHRWHPAYWGLRLLELRLYRKAVRILSKLPLAKHHIATSRADPAKVMYLPNGVDVRPFPADFPEAPEARDRFVVAYAGGITPSDGLVTLLEAAALVAHRHPELPITFRLIGEGPARTGLEDHARRLGLSNVEFLDPVPRTDVPSVLVQADVCVDIARDIGVVRDFGMSHNKLFEYLWAGRPIIFAVASANNLVAEAGAGISVEPENPPALADAVLELHGMPRLERVEMGRRGHAFVRNGYTMDTISERFVRIIEEVLDGLPPGSRVNADDITG